MNADTIFSNKPAIRLSCMALLLVAVALAGTCAFTSIGRRYLDYDEISHAHMVWLVAHGAVPYEDFGMNHLPFFWLLLAPLSRLLPESPAIFTIYRAAALALNLAFVCLLVVHAWLGRPREERPWIAAAMLIPLFQPDVLNALIEFRPDALANPLLFASLLWLRWHPRHAWLAGMLLAAALLINTKYILLPLALGVAALLRHPRNIPLRSLAGTALGLALGFILAIGILRWRQISPALAFDMVIRYNWLAARSVASNLRLADAALAHPFLLAYVAAGVVAALGLAWRGRLRWSRYAVGGLIFSVLQLLASDKGWKHYYAAWLLLAALFPALGLAVLARRTAERSWLALALCGVVAGAALHMHLVRSDALTLHLAGGPIEVTRATQTRVMDFFLARTPSNSRVVCDLFWHPVFRRDVFYKVMNDIVDGRDRFEETFAAMPGFKYADRFELPFYEKELVQKPPDIILMGYLPPGGIFSIYPPQQSRALENHLRQHESEYEFRPIDGTPLLAVVRRNPDPGNPIQGSR